MPKVTPDGYSVTNANAPQWGQQSYIQAMQNNPGYTQLVQGPGNQTLLYNPSSGQYLQFERLSGPGLVRGNWVPFTPR